MKVFVVFASLLGLIVSNAALSETKKPAGQVLNVQLSTDERKPWLDFYDADPFVAFNIAVHGLPLIFTSDMNISAGYIKSWRWDEGKKAYILTIDKSLRYHNGQPFTAYDLEFALAKPLLSKLEGLEVSYVRQIKGYEKLKRGTAFKTGILEGVKVISNESLEIYPNVNHARFLYSLNGEVPPVAPISEFGEDLFTFKSLPIGLGPYKVQSLDEKLEFVTLERVRDVKGPQTIKMYYGKSILENKPDIVLGPATARVIKVWATSKELKAEYQIGRPAFPIAVEMLEFNFTLPAVQNDNFRKAVALSIDKPKFAGPVPTDELFSSFNFGHQKREPYFDIQAAKELFKSLPKEIREKTYKLVCHGDPKREIAPGYKFIHQSLQNIGMKVEISLSGNMDFTGEIADAAMIVNGRTSDASPLVSLANYLPAEGRFKSPRNGELKTLFEKAESAETAPDRIKYIKMMSDFLVEKFIVVPIQERYDAHFFNKKIKKVGLTEITGFLDLTNTEMATSDEAK